MEMHNTITLNWYIYFSTCKKNDCTTTTHKTTTKLCEHRGPLNTGWRPHWVLYKLHDLTMAGLEQKTSVWMQFFSEYMLSTFYSLFCDSSWGWKQQVLIKLQAPAMALFSWAIMGRKLFDDFDLATFMVAA